MSADPVLFRDLAYVFIAAVAGGALAWIARQPLVLGYVLGGLLISPFTPGPSVSDTHSFEVFAEAGVVLLMFSVGIQFSLRDLQRVRWVALVGAPLGVLLTVGLGSGTGLLLGWPPLQGLIVGVVISVSSTIVLARLLMDRGELHSPHGRVLIGISLVEDLAAVVLMVITPQLGSLEDPKRILGLAMALGKSAAILVPFWYLSSKVLPPLMTRAAQTRSSELFLLFALAIGLGTAAATQAMGLSVALGAFLAGLIISESDYAHEALARLLSLRDAFVALFFVTVGVLIDVRKILDNLPLLGAIVALIIVGKFVLRTAVVWALGRPLSTAILVGMGLAQIGEFSFVLVQVARSAGHIGEDVYQATLAASLITILANAALVRATAAWVGRVGAADRHQRQELVVERQHLTGHVVLCGFGRVGSAIGEALESFDVPYVVIEMDPNIIKGLSLRGVPCLFGDAVHRRILEHAGVEHAALAIVTIPSTDRARLAVQSLRQMRPDLPILVRFHEATARQGLMLAGADDLIQPETEAAATLIRHALRRLSMPQERVLAYLERFRGVMEMAQASDRPGEALPDLEEIAVGGGLLADQTLGEGRVRERLGVTVVAITRAGGAVVMNPTAETVLRSGDRARVFGLPEQIAAFRREAGG
jgi:CPA2 family monovalent cation:H+ antiporter-2